MSVCVCVRERERESLAHNEGHPGQEPPTSTGRDGLIDIYSYRSQFIVF